MVNAPSARKKVCALVALLSGVPGRSTRSLAATMLLQPLRATDGKLCAFAVNGLYTNMHALCRCIANLDGTHMGGRPWTWILKSCVPFTFQGSNFKVEYSEDDFWVGPAEDTLETGLVSILMAHVDLKLLTPWRRRIADIFVKRRHLFRVR